MDLNADLGEECGDDVAMLSIVSSANIAAGGHAGGGEVLLTTTEAASRSGVKVGAHPSYPDRENFGRVSLASTQDPALFLETIIQQILDVAEAAERYNTRLTHVKPHGALYNDAMVNEQVALLVARATIHASAHFLLPSMPPLPVMGQPGSEMEKICRVLGVPFIPEGFADRAYRANGTLVPRSEAGAVHHDIETIKNQVKQMVETNTVTAIDGTVIPMNVLSICVHGDTPGSVTIAQAVKNIVNQAGQ